MMAANGMPAPWLRMCFVSYSGAEVPKKWGERAEDKQEKQERAEPESQQEEIWSE